MTPLGNHIIRARKRKGWDRAELARKANIPYTTLRNIEAGVSKKPQEAILRALAKALEIDEGVVFAYAGYGVIPTPTRAALAIELDALGEEAPLWHDTLERIKTEMDPDEQAQALTVLRAQLTAARRRKGRP